MKTGIYSASFRYSADLCEYLFKKFIFYPYGHESFKVTLGFGPNPDDDKTFEIYEASSLVEIINKYNPRTISVDKRWKYKGDEFEMGAFVTEVRVPDSSDHFIYGFTHYDVFIDYDKD